MGGGGGRGLLQDMRKLLGVMDVFITLNVMPIPPVHTPTSIGIYKSIYIKLHVN